ncbi:MAG: TlpA disulfide reductase family protein [Betaproteobacteria bacterium]
MSMPDNDGADVNRKAQLRRAGFIALGGAVVAASIVGVWFSLRPSATSTIPDVRLVADERRALTLTPYPSPRPIANVTFEDATGRKRTLADFQGKVVLLNLWATWCGPCRKEMPTLDRLQSQLGSADFEVVALSIDRDGQAAVKSFFDEINVQRLGIYVDASAEAGRKLEIVGVPTTLLLDRTGREILRVVGPADWDRPEVIATIQRYLAVHP